MLLAQIRYTKHVEAGPFNDTELNTSGCDLNSSSAIQTFGCILLRPGVPFLSAQQNKKKRVEGMV